MNKTIVAIAILMMIVGLVCGVLALADIAANGCLCLGPPCWC